MLLDGIGTVAKFSSPQGVCVNNVDSAPTMLYVADTYNNAIRAIVLATANVTTLAGQLRSQGWADGAGIVARFNHPSACAVSADNATLYVADTGNAAIRKMGLAGTYNVTTIIGSGCTSDSSLCSVPDGQSAAYLGCCSVGLLSAPCSSTASDPAYCYTPGTGTSASFSEPQSLILSYASPCSGSGCLWVSDGVGTLSVVDLSASPPTMYLAQCFDNFDGTSCDSCTAAGGCASYTVQNMVGLAMSGSGDVFVADRTRFGVLSCTPGNSLSTLASCSYIIGQKDTPAFKYITRMNAASSSVEGHSSVGSWYDETDGAPLTAGFVNPFGLAFDKAAHPPALFISDFNAMRLAIFPDGQTPTTVSTVAGGGDAAPPSTYAHTAFTGTNAGWLEPVPAHINQPVSGATNGIGTSASFSSTCNIVAVHATRIVYIADSGNDLIRSMTYTRN